MDNKKCDITQSNSNGKLWIETKDFFGCPTVIKMVKQLSESNLVKTIENRLTNQK